MTPGKHRLGAGAVLLIITATATSCSAYSGETHRVSAHVNVSPPTGASAPPASSVASGASSSRSRPDSPSAKPSSPPSLEVPAKTAGSMSLRSFPSPRTLGSGWHYSVDPGSLEDGYLGNGTPAVQRNPAEVVSAAVPLGCRRPATMTTPRHALEVDYRHHGTKVIAIRSIFDGPEAARSFFAARAQNLQACRGQVSNAAEGVLVSRVERVVNDVLLSDRTPKSAPWSELAVLDHDAVVLLAAQAPLTRSPFGPEQPARLARIFRG